MRSIFTAFLLLCGLYALPASAQEQRPLIGQSWLTEKGKARVAFSPCPTNGSRLCGSVVWLAEPNDKKTGQPKTDVLNKNPKEKGRPIVGMTMVENFTWRDDAWRGGTIYDPESGERYNATLQTDGRFELKVTGCVLFLCRAQRWTEPKMETRKTK
ncbi:DUF2147 domain-containing protein [Lacibacterium aquatile]|uniref:DUF2147 domain-containing protein n=1 Tax=Lacibacterium aquatile TaxID=1168082 RepID=A0ABW5DPT9_9PROT